jgi:hypothetical protein
MAVLALCALPSCGLVRENVDGYVNVTFEIDEEGGHYCSNDLFNPGSEGGDWSEGEGVSVDRDDIVQASILTVRTHGVVTCKLCVAPGAPRVKEHAIPFTYGRYGGARRGTFVVTTASPLSVKATATPDTIPAGESALLQVSVFGGVPLYEYAWSPSDGLSDTNVPSPIASPTVTTTYTVQVTDSVGQQATASVTVTVSSPECRPLLAPCTANEQCCSKLCHPRNLVCIEG